MYSKKGDVPIGTSPFLYSVKSYLSLIGNRQQGDII